MQSHTLATTSREEEPPVFDPTAKLIQAVRCKLAESGLEAIIQGKVKVVKSVIEDSQVNPRLIPILKILNYFKITRANLKELLENIDITLEAFETPSNRILLTSFVNDLKNYRIALGIGSITYDINLIVVTGAAIPSIGITISPFKVTLNKTPGRKIDETVKIFHQLKRVLESDLCRTKSKLPLLFNCQNAVELESFYAKLKSPSTNLFSSPIDYNRLAELINNLRADLKIERTYEEKNKVIIIRRNESTNVDRRKAKKDKNKKRRKRQRVNHDGGALNQNYTESVPLVPCSTIETLTSSSSIETLVTSNSMETLVTSTTTHSLVSCNSMEELSVFESTSTSFMFFNQAPDPKAVVVVEKMWQTLFTKI